MFETLYQTLIMALCLGGVALLVSMLLTKALLKLLPKWGLVDKPDFKRHIHTVAVPRGGGLAIIVAFVAVILSAFSVFSFQNAPSIFQEILKFLAPLAILVPVGIIDDKRGLRPKTKLLFQIVSAVIAWYFGIRLQSLFGLHIHGWPCLLLTVLWIVAFINAFNMIDGVDGLASGIGIISAICMAIISLSFQRYVFATLLIVFAASLLGFLFYNCYPARLFMGDTGSMFIGYVLAVAGLKLNARLASVASIFIPILACGIPLLDIIFAVWRRIMGSPHRISDKFTIAQEPATEAGGDVPEDQAAASEEGPYAHENLPRRLGRIAGRLGTADQSHIHHRLLQYFQRDQKKTVRNIYSIAMIMGIVAIVCSYCPKWNLALVLMLVLGTFAFIINRLAFIELWQTTEIVYHNFQTPHTGVVISYVLNPLADLLFIFLAYICSSHHTHLAFVFLVRYLCIIMIVLFFSRSYRVFWNFAVSDDYLRLIATLLFGFFLAWNSDFLIGSPNIPSVHSFAATIAIAFILMERLGIHYFRNAQASHSAKEASETIQHRDLLLGVSPLTRFYRNLLMSDMERAASEKIIGLVVFNKTFLHSYCFGMKVLGDAEHLAEIARETKATKVVLTKTLAPEDVDALKQLCQEHHLEFYEFSYSEKKLN